jgi:ribosomal protein S18 acetylase RimI-like enzyme
MLRFRFLCIGVLLLLVVGQGFACFQFRTATPDDVGIARKILFQQAMNPLSLSQQNLMVAYDETLSHEPLLGFGQIRKIDSSFSELASLYVLPERRKQGIGGALVEALLKRLHSESSSSPNNRVCLLTLQPTTKFYETYGFQVASEMERKQLPASLQFEFNVGTVVSVVLGNDLVCMVQ